MSDDIAALIERANAQADAQLDYHGDETSRRTWAVMREAAAALAALQETNQARAETFAEFAQCRADLCDARTQLAALRDALRNHVVAQYTLGATGARTWDEHCCDECGTCWPIGGPEKHAPGCLAAIDEAMTELQGRE